MVQKLVLMSESSQLRFDNGSDAVGCVLADQFPRAGTDRAFWFDHLLSSSKRGSPRRDRKWNRRIRIGVSDDIPEASPAKASDKILPKKIPTGWRVQGQDRFRKEDFRLV